MRKFGVCQHTYSEFLGLIESQLEKRDIGFDYFRPFLGQHLPGSAVQHDALFLLGGAGPTVDRDSHPWIDEELGLIERFRAASKPVVGIGFGALLLVEQAGGVPLSEPPHTARWVTARKTAAGDGDALAEVLDGREVLVLHRGSARPPVGVGPTLVDDEGNWLALRPDRSSYALLFRPELKPGMLEDIVMEGGPHVPANIGELLAQSRERWDETQRTTAAVLVALVSELDLMTERRKPPIIPLKVE